MKFSSLLLSAALLAATPALAQVEERTLPSEWNQLIPGGRHMDRFEAMPKGHVTKANWGAPAVRNRLIDNGIEADNMSFWGGNIIKDDQGTYHLYVCGWPENSRKGHMFWGNSTTFHATSQTLSGPYKVQNSIGKGHNPEAYVLEDGRIVVYVIDGYYIADRPEGPWIYGKFQFDARGHKIIEGLSNLTFCRRPDGSRLMVCRGGGVWISRDGLSTYRQITPERVYPPVDGRFEDPVVWRDSLQYHLIVNDWLGRVAWYERSLDGLHWIVEPGEAYIPGISRHQDGHVEEWFKYERAKVFQDAEGRVTQMNFAVIDTLKDEDRPNDSHSSKNICVPMNKGLLLEVINKEALTAKTKTVELRIRGEKDFDPANEVDLNSIVFGSYNLVNYGRGAKVVKSRREGRDLILSFKAKDTGITADEWAPKLIGRNKNGHLLWGYARLPWVNYRPAILSPTPLTQNANGSHTVTVTNFGLSTSQPTTLTLKTTTGDNLQVHVPSLTPYEEIELTAEKY